VVPLAVPAAVGLSWLYRSGIALWADRDTIGAGLVAVILVVVTLQAGAIVVTDVYTQPQAENNELVQYAQAHDDLDPVIEDLSTAASDGDTPDAIVYYGLKGADYDSNAALVKKERALPRWDVRPTCTNWGNLQPMNWYFAVADATVTCDREPENLTAAIEQDPPAVVITQPDDYTVPEETLDAAYDSEAYYLRTVDKQVIVYTRQSQ
jgi:predicted membrane-bound mannosyltransferase